MVANTTVFITLLHTFGLVIPFILTVIGFERTEYTFEERDEAYQLTVQVFSNTQTIRDRINVAIVSGSGNATGKG